MTAPKRDPDLKPEFYGLEESAYYLNCSDRLIPLFRKYKLLKSIKFGRHFVYKRSWLDQFAEEWAGYDLSSEHAILSAINEKEWRKKHGYE